MKKIYNIIIILFIFVMQGQAQMPFQVQLVVNDAANTLIVKLRNVENNQPTTSQNITSINMRLLGSVPSIISIASTNYTMLMPSTMAPNTQVITMNSTSLPSPENWVMNQWYTVVVYNLMPATYTASSFSVQADLDGDNSDVQDPIMSVAASGVFNIPLTIQGTLLPVELLTFDATNINNEKTLLEWESAFEVNFDLYEIERSADGRSFKQIGEVTGQGRSAYSFNDEEPLFGVNYYRLKMVDLDGKFEYSNIKDVKFSRDLKLELYPNPSATGEITFAIRGIDSQTDLSLSVTNAAGAVVKSINLKDIDSDSDNMTVYIDTPGVYFLRIVLTSGEIFTEKLVIGSN